MQFLTANIGKCDLFHPVCHGCSLRGLKDCEYKTWRKRAKGKAAADAAATAPDPPAGGALNVESHDDSTPKFQIDDKYWCTLCHKRFEVEYIWAFHEARCYLPEAQHSCSYCDGIFDSEAQFRVHHCDKHVSSPRLVRCSVTRTRRAGWGCGFCAAFLDSWNERLYHVSDHFETGSRSLAWKYSNVIRGLLRQPEIARHWQDLLVGKHGPNPESRLTILFGEPETGRPESGLQGMLEFQTPERDLEAIAQLAYDLGVRPHLNDAVDVTAAETECASKFLDVVLLKESEKDSARYVTCDIYQL
jgi:hypothetical protein